MRFSGYSSIHSVVDTSKVDRCIRNIFSEGELDKKSNVQFLHIPNSEKPVAFYGLDAILAVGYRVKSQRGIQFRQWATGVLHHYNPERFGKMCSSGYSST